MKTVFIVNPKAGCGKNIDSFIETIKDASLKMNISAQIYITRAVGDATIFVRNYCEKNGAARFIACGGDGTLNEVLNGAIGFENAEIGVIPIGTGNDFCRNFNEDNCFENVLLQFNGECASCDAIKYRTKLGKEIKEGYCVNMFNIGFDCNVADLTQSIKEKRYLSGSLAYFVSIFITLIKKKCSHLKVEVDGRERHSGKLLLTSVANGCYCGGGIRSNPLAAVNDGLININIIKNVSRIKFVSLLPYYMNGTFLKIKGIEKYILSEKCRFVKITPFEKKIRLCIDGEIVDAGETEFEILHNAFKFVLPVKMQKQTNEVMA